MHLWLLPLWLTKLPQSRGPDWKRSGLFVCNVQKQIFSVASGTVVKTESNESVGEGLMRVLVVEDDKRLATNIRRGLEAEGYAVDVELDGEAGLWSAKENAFDAIVLDIMLPKLNGFQVCRQLRDAGIWTPILMLTAKDGELDEAEALDTGADDFLSKPFSYVVLVAHLRALMRRGVRERPVELSVGDLFVDPAAHSCRRGEAEVVLTAREFSILEFLIRRAGEVVSKSEILAHVWDFAYEGDASVIEVHVSSLRKKIDAPFERNGIQTIRGVGYRLAANGG